MDHTVLPAINTIPAVYATEYTNSLTLRGLPPYKLNIKLGAPIMLLHTKHVG